MVLRMSRPFKHPKTGVYYYRRAVPPQLRAAIGKSELKESLATKDPGEAKARYAPVAAKYEALLAQAALIGCNAPIKAFAASLLGPQKEPLPSLTEDEARDAAQRRALSDPNRVSCQVTVSGSQLEKLRVAGRPIPHGPISEIILGRSGQSSGEPVSATLSAPAGNNVPPLSFNDLLCGWAAERQPMPKTIYDWKRFASQVAAFVGHHNAAAVTADNILAWKNRLLVDGLSAKTINTRLTAVTGLYSWAIENRKLVNNPAKGIQVKSKRRQGSKRKPFTEAEARIILARAFLHDDPAIKWSSLLQAYTGDRISSIAQLRKEDVSEHGGFYVLDLNDDFSDDDDADEHRTQKTEGSIRKVPLHSAVIEAGFITFVNSAPDGPLFRGVKPDRFGKRGGVLTKRYSRFLRKDVGITDRRKVNHSWRHTFKDLCREYDIPEAVSHRITGHSSNGDGEDYGDGFSLKRLFGYLERLPDLTK